MEKLKKSHIIFKKHFQNWNKFTKQDIYEFYLARGKNLSDAALRWRIHDMKNEGIIQSIEAGVYTISNNPVFIPDGDKMMMKIVKLFNQKYKGLDYCIWNTNLLNNFTIHQSFKFFYVFDTDRDITESVFYHFKENNLNVFNNPGQQIMDDYVVGGTNAIVLRPLVSRSPAITENEITFPSLEKILVDIFCDQHQFYAYGGHEMEIIFENAFRLYNINFSSLLAYADRRGRKRIIRDFIEEYVLFEMTE
jgi:hypothetical protein